MNAAQTLKLNGKVQKNGALLGEYSLLDKNGGLIATVQQRTEDGNIHCVCWYGGDKHGKSSLTDGGIEGLMDFVGQAA
mgnify:FL=1